MLFQAPVDFHITDDEEKLARLAAHAREVDETNGAFSPAEYTVEQAFTVIWHDDPDWLVQNEILVGWTIESPDLWAHLTDSVTNEFSTAGMLRQVALVQEFGDKAQSAVELLTCSCQWRQTAATHKEALAKRAAHERLEYLRRALRAEHISYEELAELQSLAEYIEPGDVELLEPAGVPEQP